MKINDLIALLQQERGEAEIDRFVIEWPIETDRPAIKSEEGLVIENIQNVDPFADE